jgi:guanine nucleotide-binding protein G(i) subunit alpha
MSGLLPNQKIFPRDIKIANDDNSLFDAVTRISDSEYIPTDIDILGSRIKTTGITETTFELNGMPAKFYDPGGTRSERKKWIHTFKKVNAIVFLVDIAAYDRSLFEDESANRMQEALTVFESIVNSRHFPPTQTRFILLFTKVDRLEETLRRSPIRKFFPDFEGDEKNVENFKAYIGSRFLALNQHKDKQIEVVYASFAEGYAESTSKVLEILSRWERLYTSPPS